MAHRIIDEKGHVIPEKVETDIRNAYALVRRHIGDFHHWIAHPQEAEKKIAEAIAKENEKSEPKVKFDPTDPKFQSFVKANPRYAELTAQMKAADTDEKRQAVKKACAEFFDEMKKAYVETMKKAA